MVNGTLGTPRQGQELTEGHHHREQERGAAVTIQGRGCGAANGTRDHGGTGEVSRHDWVPSTTRVAILHSSISALLTCCDTSSWLPRE